MATAALGLSAAGLAHAANATATATNDNKAAKPVSSVEWLENHPVQAVIIFTIITIVLYTIAFTYYSEIEELVRKIIGKPARRHSARRSNSNSPFRRANSAATQIEDAVKPARQVKRSLSRGSSTSYSNQAQEGRKLVQKAVREASNSSRGKLINSPPISLTKLIGRKQNTDAKPREVKRSLSKKVAKGVIQRVITSSSAKKSDLE